MKVTHMLMNEPIKHHFKASIPSLLTILTTHCNIIKLGTIYDTYIANNLLNSYIKTRNLKLAHKVFDEMPQRDTVTWNSLIAGFVNNGDFGCAWGVLIRMKRNGFCFDEYTFGSVLKGVAFNECLFVGQQVHGSIVKTGYGGSVYSGSALLDMYAKCGTMVDARKVFDGLGERNTVSWNALISGYVESGDRVNSFELFKCMHREGMRTDDGTFSPLLTLFDSPELYKLTMQVHCMIIKHGMLCDSSVVNVTISAYSDCGSIDDAKGVFDGAGGERDIVSWNAMLAASLEHNKQAMAFNLFSEMQISGFEPDTYTYSTVISSCFEEDVCNQGQSLHALVIKKGVEHLTPISNSLMAMYSGSNGIYMDYATRIFENMTTIRIDFHSIDNTMIPVTC